MASLSAPKVVLKSTTSMSLNERFTEMLTSKQPVRVTIQTEEHPGHEQEQHEQPRSDTGNSSELSRPGSFPPLANWGNRKLAQEMESRPSVRAALTLKADSLKQRLGKSNIRARLGWPFGSEPRRGGWGGPYRGGSSNGGPSHGGSFHRGPSGGGGSSRAAEARGEMRAEQVSRSRQRGSGGAQPLQDQESRQRRSASPQMSGRKGGVRQGFGWEGSTGHRSHSSSTGRGEGLLGGGGRRRHVASQAPLTKEQLDDQLDAYMAKTRGQLDAERDTYKAQKDQKSSR